MALNVAVMEVSGKVAVVTGAGAGTGRVIALTLAGRVLLLPGGESAELL